MATVITAQNGRLAANLLTRVRTGQPLRHACANSYNRLDAHMRASGQGALTLSAGLSGYRTLADQQHMRNLGLTTIAVGRSPHGEGVAADFQGLGGLNGVRYRWLRNNAGPFGWFHPAWAQAGGVNPSPHHWEYDQRRDTGAGSGDDMPSAEEVAAAVWRFAIHGKSPIDGAPWSDSAAHWLRDGRIAAVPEVHARHVWGTIIAGHNPTTGEPWRDTADAWLRDARMESQPALQAHSVWDHEVAPGVPARQAQVDTVSGVAALETDHHAHLSSNDVQRIAHAVVDLLRHDDHHHHDHHDHDGHDRDHDDGDRHGDEDL